MIFGIIGLIVIMTLIAFLCISFFITIFGGGPFVPTPYPAVHKTLKAAGIKKNERVFDIGAGDGRFLHFAEKDYQAQAEGFEIDPFVFFLSKLRKWFWGWKGQVHFGSFFKGKLKKADIIICYMLPRTMKKFRNHFEKKLKKGTRIVSYAFHIPGWKPLKTIPRKGKISKILVYEIGKHL